MMTHDRGIYHNVMQSEGKLSVSWTEKRGKAVAFHGLRMQDVKLEA